MKMMKTMMSAIALTAIAGTALATDFKTFDANADGQVDLLEYKTMAMKDGKTEAVAMQEFSEMSQGNAFITRSAFTVVPKKPDAYVDEFADSEVALEAPVLTPLESFVSSTEREVAEDMLTAGEIKTSNGINNLNPQGDVMRVEDELTLNDDVRTEDDIEVPQAPELPDEIGDIN